MRQHPQGLGSQAVPKTGVDFVVVGIKSKRKRGARFTGSIQIDLFHRKPFRIPYPIREPF